MPKNEASQHYETCLVVLTAIFEAYARKKNEIRKLMKKKKDLKYTLERLYKCRDLEITNLWQRSVFLSVFMLLCFSGYGYLLDKMVTVDDATYYELAAIKQDSTFIKNIDSLAQSIKKGKDTYVLKIENLKANNNLIPINNLKIKQSVKLELNNYNLVAVGIAIIGVIFSVLWIAMAKGSKAWYEVYENAISNLEYENYSKLGIPYPYVMGNMGLYKDKKDNCIFSTKAGAYSPAKINIVLGQVSLLIWGIIALIHLLSCFGCTCNVKCSTIMFVFLTIIIIFICLLLLHIMKSSFLDTNPILARLSKNYSVTKEFYKNNFEAIKNNIDKKDFDFKTKYETKDCSIKDCEENTICIKGECISKQIVEAINDLIRTENVTKDDFKEESGLNEKILFYISKFLLMILLILVVLTLIGILYCK
jgi:hypothetical protein